MTYTPQLLQHLSALSTHLQARRAAGLKKLFADGCEEQVARAVGLGGKPAELEAALENLGATLYAEVAGPDESARENAQDVREIASLLSDVKDCAGGCGLFEFERTVEAVSFRMWDYARSLE